MTKAALIKAKKIEEEIDFISKFVLPQLNDVYANVVDHMDTGYKELDVDFYFGRRITTILTLENVLSFIETEIKTVTKHKECLEKELEEL